MYHAIAKDLDEYNGGSQLINKGHRHVRAKEAQEIYSIYILFSYQL